MKTVGLQPTPAFFFEKKKQKTFNVKVFVHFFQKVAGVWGRAPRFYQGLKGRFLWRK